MSQLQRASSSSSPISESNPLLLELQDKKQTLRRFASEVGSMASELKDVRSRVVAQESALEQEITRRQTAEARVKAMEMELELMKKNLQEKEAHAISASAFAEQYLRELVDVRAKLKSTEDIAHVNGGCLSATQLQRQTLTKEIEIRTDARKEHEVHTSNLQQQLDLQEQLSSREISQSHIRDEVETLQTETRLAVSRATVRKESDAKSAFQESPVKHIELHTNHMNCKEEELSRLREEIKYLSTQLKLRTRELQTQIERHRAVEQDLKKRVLKLEFWLQESRSQTRRLQRVVERQEKDLKDIQAHVTSNPTGEKVQSGIWSSSTVKIFVSFSLMALVVFSRR